MKIGAQIKTKGKLKLPVNKASSNTVRSFDSNMNENFLLLQKHWGDYTALGDFRSRYQKNEKYLFNNQWGDQIYDPSSRSWMTEETYLRTMGRVPLKQNYCANLMRTLNGLYRRNPSQSMVNARAKEAALQAEMMSNALHAELNFNNAIEKNSQLMKLFALSGAMIQKVKYEYIDSHARDGIKLTNRNLNYMSWNTDIKDLMLDDMIRIGEIHDLYPDEVVAMFAKNDKEAERIREIYVTAANTKDYWTSQCYMDPENYYSIDFYYPMQINKCRVYESWTKKSEWRITNVWDYFDPNPSDYGKTWDLSYERIFEEENAKRRKQGLAAGIPEDEIELITYRKQLHTFWYYKFLSPWGHCFDEGESPYLHNEHPYVFTLFPLIDGEVRGWFEDIIDLQRQINRMLILMDMVISNSAKGVWMIDEASKPDNYTFDQYVDTITRAGGIVFYKSKPNVALPQYLVSQSSSVGIAEMLQISLKLIDDISGLQGAIQGRTANSGTPASLYEQEAANSSISTIEFMQVIANHKQRCDLKIIKLIKQYYNYDRYIATAGKQFSEEAKMYKVDEVNQFDYDTVVTHNLDTPVFREAMEGQLQNFVAQGFLPFKQYLEVSTLPNAQKLLDQINKIEQKAAQGQNGQIPPELAQAAQNGDPKAQAMIQQLSSSQESQQVLAPGQGSPTVQQQKMPLVPSR